MPQMLMVAGTKLLISVGLSKAVATSVATFAIKAATLTALSVASAALTPQVGASASPRQGQPDVNAPIHIASGRFGASGHVVWNHETWGQDNRLWTRAVVIARAGPIKSLLTYKLDDVTVPISGGVATGRYAEALWMDTQLGAQPESSALAPPVLPGHGSPSGWGANHKLSGCAAFLRTTVQNKEHNRFVGPLNDMWTGEGCYVYDPRLDSTYPGGSGSCRLATPSTWVWSECPALHALKWALGHWEDPTGKGAPGVGKLVCGMGVKPEGIDFASFVHLANVSDANGWTVSAWPSSADSPKQVLDAYLQAAGGIYADINGRLGCISRGASQTASITVTPADLAGPAELDCQSSLIDRQNTLTPRFMSEDHGWQLTPLDPITDSDWLDDDNGDERGADYDLPFVRDKDQAGQLTYLAIAHTREPIRGTAPLRPYMSHIKPGTRFTFDAPGSDLEEVKCLCLQAQYDPKAKTWTVSFVSETDAKYTKAGTVSPDAPAPSTYDPPDRSDPNPPTSDEWTLTGGVVGTGVTQPAVIIEGATDDAYALSILVEHREDGADEWIGPAVYSASSIRMVVTGLKPQTDYEVRLRYLTRFGATSDPLILGPVTTGGLNAGSAAEVPWSGVQNDNSLRPADGATVGARAGTDIFRTDGVTPLAQSEIRTAEGTSAFVQDQGTLATRNTVASAHIDARAVTPSRIALTDRINLFPDPDLGDDDIWNSVGSVAKLATPLAMGSEYIRRLLTTGSTNYYELKPTFAIKVEPGEVIRIGFAGYINASSGQMVFSARWYSDAAASTFISSSTIGVIENTATLTRVASIVTAPSTARRLIIRIARTPGGTGTANFGEPVVERVSALGRTVVDEDGSLMTRTNIATRSRSAGVNPAGVKRLSNGAEAPMGGQPFKAPVSDGTPVTYDQAFASAPLVTFENNSLDALGAGEYYRLRALDQDGAGFTPDIKIVSPGAGATYTARSDDTPAVVGPASALERHKGNSGVSAEGKYDFVVTWSAQVNRYETAGDGFPDSTPTVVRIWVLARRGASDPWTAGGYVDKVLARPTSPGVPQIVYGPTTETIQGDFGQWDTFDIHAGTEWRVQIEVLSTVNVADTATLQAFDAVEWLQQTGGSAPSVRSALSDGRTTNAIITPLDG